MNQQSQARVYFNEQLLNLIRDKDNSVIIKQSLKGANAWNAQDQLGNTLLHYAAKYNNYDIVQYLIEFGSIINLQNDSGRTPIVEAIETGSDKATQILLQAGADIYKANRWGETALQRFFQAENHIKDTLELVVLNKVQVDCSFNNESIANVLCNANCQLPYVILLRNVEVTKTMLQRGCPVDALNGKNQTALHIAVISVDAELVKLLLQYNANPNAMDHIDRSPLGYLYSECQEHSEEHFRILNMLIVRNAAFTLRKGSISKSQIVSVLKFGNKDAIQHLLFADLDLNERIDISENTPIHILAQNQTPDVFEALDKQNFEVDVRNRFAETPLLIAAERGNVHVIEYLVKRGADVNALDRSGVSPLFNAICAYTEYEKNQLIRTKNSLNHFKECVELLLKYGADAQHNPARTAKGPSKVLQLIRNMSSYDMGKLLIEDLVVKEALGTKITSHTRNFIDDEPTYKAHYDICKQQLLTVVDKSITLFDLLSANELKFEKYGRNQQMQRFCNDENSNGPYINKILMKKMSNAVRMIGLKKDATFAMCSIMKMKYKRFHTIAEKIIDYLNERDLENLLVHSAITSELLC